MKKLFVFLVILFGMVIHDKVHAFTCAELVMRLRILLALSETSKELKALHELDKNLPVNAQELSWENFYQLIKNKKMSDEAEEVLALIQVLSNLNLGCSNDQNYEINKVISDSIINRK